MKRFIFLSLCGLLAFMLSISCSEKLDGPLSPQTIYDTTFDTTVVITPPDTVYDTTVIGPDTLVDTVFFPPDTIRQTDTLLIIDTVEIPIYVVDSVYDTTIVIEVSVDTLFIPVKNLVFKSCQYWKLKDGQMSVSIQLENPAGTYLVGFERIRLTTEIPESVELIVDYGDEQIFQKSIHGNRHFIDWSSPVTLLENATVIISLDEPWFAGKITDAMCREYFKGFWWLGVQVPELQ